jgi:sec-independent protein translocase protein TatC
MAEDFASFWEHLADLRQALIKALAVIMAGMVLAFFFSQPILTLLTVPLKASTSQSLGVAEIKRERIYNHDSKDQLYDLTGKLTYQTDGVRHLEANQYLLPPGTYIEIEKILPPAQLVVLGPLEGMLASLKVSFWVGLVGTSPIWLYFVLQFIMPALHPKEKLLLWPFLILSVLFLTIGGLFAYFVTIPLANIYLQTFNSAIGINLWSLVSYLDYTLTLIMANALACEICLLLLFAVHYGFVSTESLTAKRRHMIVAAFILGAILTPPDVLTQFMLAIPLIALYEMSILYSKIKAKGKRQKAKI